MQKRNPNFNHFKSDQNPRSCSMHLQDVYPVVEQVDDYRDEYAERDTPGCTRSSVAVRRTSMPGRHKEYD